MRTLSLNARRSPDEEVSDTLEVILMKITHPDLDDPVRLSTDPTERITTEPLVYGTRSTWLTTDSSPFLFVSLAAQLPDDLEGTPQAGALVLEAVDNDVNIILRSTTTPATVDMAVVLAESPDQVEAEFRDLEMVSAEGGKDTITIQVTRELLSAEPWPSGRMTRARFPGQRRR